MTAAARFFLPFIGCVMAVHRGVVTKATQKNKAVPVRRREAGAARKAISPSRAPREGNFAAAAPDGLSTRSRLPPVTPANLEKTAIR